MIKINDAFEPAIDPSSQESLQAFMNTRFKESTKLGKVMVTDELQGFLDGYKANRTMETDYAKTKAMFGNELRSALIAYSCDEISSADGKVLASYREDTAGKLILRVN
jgi:hypothetical protein